MIIERLELQFETGTTPEGILDRLLELFPHGLNSPLPEVGFELSARAQLGPALWAGDDGIVGRIIGHTDSGVPAHLAMKRNGDVALSSDIRCPCPANRSQRPDHSFVFVKDIIAERSDRRAPGRRHAATRVLTPAGPE